MLGSTNAPNIKGALATSESFSTDLVAQERFKMKICLLFIVCVVRCSALPAPAPQIQIPFFGNIGGANNGTNQPQQQLQGFISGIGGMMNNLMSSVWKMLPIPRSNQHVVPAMAAGQLPPLPLPPPQEGLVLLPADAPLPTGGVPVGPVMNTPQDGANILQMLQQQQRSDGSHMGQSILLQPPRK